MQTRLRIFTVGHSTQSFESFLGLLKMHAITAIADVRSSPYSKYSPQFNIDVLQSELNKNGIKYVFLGKELGARSEDDKCYVGDVVSYEKLSNTIAFQNGIRRLEDGCGRYTIALMCSERDPIECHRAILVSKVLEERGAEINHILGNGELEAHRNTMLRVLDLLGMPHDDMFHTEDELISQAYAGREKQVAYRREG